jgi:hypothetical protein
VRLLVLVLEAACRTGVDLGGLLDRVGDDLDVALLGLALDLFRDVGGGVRGVLGLGLPVRADAAPAGGEAGGIVVDFPELVGLSSWNSKRRIGTSEALGG